MKNIKEERSNERLPFIRPIQCTVMGLSGMPPSAAPASIEAEDLSSDGMKIKCLDWVPEAGALVSVRIPLIEKKVFVPVLARIQWTKQETESVWHAGMQFLT